MVGSSRPYRRTVRQFLDGLYSEGGRSQYIYHKKFSQTPELYIRSFLIIQKDLQTLFDYVEPADKNLGCYSYRIHELLTRSCIEIESNFKAIFIENGNPLPKKQNWNITDYKKINKTHLLSSYSIKVPYWDGNNKIRKPFEAWESDNPLEWYQAYNSTKHNRHESFKEATLDHALNAICGLLVLLSAQFHTKDFSPKDIVLTFTGHLSGMEEAIGGYFRIEFPDNFPVNERYSFKWNEIKDLEDPFQNYNYNLTKK